MSWKFSRPRKYYRTLALHTIPLFISVSDRKKKMPKVSHTLMKTEEWVWSEVVIHKVIYSIQEKIFLDLTRFGSESDPAMILDEQYCPACEWPFLRSLFSDPKSEILLLSWKESVLRPWFSGAYFKTRNQRAQFQDYISGAWRHQFQDPKSEGPISRPRIRDPDFETPNQRPRFWDPKSETPILRPRIRDPDFETPNQRPRFWDPESETPILRSPNPEIRDFFYFTPLQREDSELSNETCHYFGDFFFHIVLLPSIGAQFWYPPSEGPILRPGSRVPDFETPILRPWFWDPDLETPNQRRRFWDPESETPI